MRNTEIDGLVMDTPFTVIRLYHTAVLVAISHKVGIPLAIAFGRKESILLYDKFYAFFDNIGINLRGYILESDQGSALISIGKRHPRHLFCLHHVLKSLSRKGKCGRFARLVGNMISARSEAELNVFKEEYIPDFLQVCETHGPEEAQLKLRLGKVGLGMTPDGLEVADQQRWSQVSMLERVGTTMPSTTNTIECLNGHMNEATPRNNTFWGSLHRIAWIFTRKIDSFPICVQHNLRNERRQIYKQLGSTSVARMQREVQFFGTTADSCRCGQTILAAQMIRWTSRAATGSL
jgi:hypothetical protein